jgi:hypothetical protein
VPDFDLHELITGVRRFYSVLRISFSMTLREHANLSQKIFPSVKGYLDGGSLLSEKQIKPTGRPFLQPDSHTGGHIRHFSAQP